MPWVVDDKNCVRKDSESGALVKCFDNAEDANAYMRALYANEEKKSLPVVEMSMSIIKASYNKTDSNPRKWRAVGSDTESDLYNEKMSPEIFSDFVYRIEQGIPIPEVFRETICEESWCGGMPYLSIAHYKAGQGQRNVPGLVESLYVDGSKLKATGILYDNAMGRKVFDELCDDLYLKSENDPDHLPIRISIGFLDLEHKHEFLDKEKDPDFIFTRRSVGQICPLCAKGIGGKIYMKGQLVHLALTRVPVNPRTEMAAEIEMTDPIVTKKDDAASIIGEDLVDELDERSLAEGTLVIRAEGENSKPVEDDPFASCYDSVRDFYDQDCINAKMRSLWKELNKYVQTVKSNADVVDAETKTTIGKKSDVTEAVMDNENVENTEEVAEAVAPVTEPVEAPAPEKSMKEEEGQDEEDEAGDEEEMKSKTEESPLDKVFAELKSRLGKGASVEEIQNAFNALGQEVEKSYAPPAPSANDIAALIESAVEKAITPLRVELTALKAQGNVGKSVGNDIPVPRSLNLGQSLLQKSQPHPQQPTRKLSQIEAIARKSTGAYVPEE